MRIIFTTFLLFLSLLVHAQVNERIVSGRLTGNDGSGLPGVNVVVKGTAVGTSTDAEGYYSISAPIGSVLVFSFIGMQTTEAEVTEDNLKPLKQPRPENPVNKKTNTREIKMRTVPSWAVSIFSDSVKNSPGVFVMTDKTSVYYPNAHVDSWGVQKIRRTGRLRTIFHSGNFHSPDAYFVKTTYAPVRTGFHLQLTSSLTAERVTQLPGLQNMFSQGRSAGGQLTWLGPETGEPYSWGPLIRTLSFDGSDYAYDKNGKITTASQTALKPALPYNPLTYFSTGLSNETDLIFSVPVLRNATMVVGAARNFKKSVIPFSEFEKHNFSFQLKSLKPAEGIDANIITLYNRADGNLLSRGSNLSNIFASVLQTPATFDNSNGLNKKNALSSRDTYALPDGSMRSYAPAVADNPFALVHNLPDEENSRRIFAAATIRFRPDHDFSIVANANIDRQWSDVVFGISPGLTPFPKGRMTERKERQTIFTSSITPSFQTYSYGGTEIKTHVSYHYTHQARALQRTDAVGFTPDSWGQIRNSDSALLIGKEVHRDAHELLFNVLLSRQWFNARVTSRNYYSSTLSRKVYTNIFPSVSVSADLAELLNSQQIYRLKIYGSLARTIREAPLIYPTWNYLSTSYLPGDFKRYSESSEIFLPQGLLPETERKFETGIKLSALRGLDIELAYFNNMTDRFIMPVSQQGNFQLENAARVKNYGLTVSSSYARNFRALRWMTKVKWHGYNSVVDHIYGGEKFLPVAGFKTTTMALAENKPVGAIYGTTFVRNEAGQLVIDSEGFPIADNELKMIGNSIPDWTAGFENSFEWKRIHVAFLFDIKEGGDMWNGTRAMLDYTGRSSETARQRSMTGYLFEGVNVNGQRNTLAVSLYDPSKPVEENYWMRYGETGVGEKYIEDASWIRLNELALSYTFRVSRSIKELKVSLAGRNLFVSTPYSGVDPSSSLFDYANATGLDLFNIPATRSYSAQIILKI